MEDEEEEDNIVEEYDDDGDDDGKMQDVVDGVDDEMRVRNYLYRSSLDLLILRYCIVFVDVEWLMILAWSSDRMGENFVREYDAYSESESRSLIES